MLTLLEPPGKQHQRLQSGQFLLQVEPNNDEDEEYANAYDEDRLSGDLDDSTQGGCLAPLEKVLDKHLVGKSSSDDYPSERWKREFRARPTWCDADLALQQIKRKRATGNRWALYSRSFIQKCLFTLGDFVQNHALSIIVIMMIAFTLCCYGLQFVRIETDIVKLWVAKGGRLDEELSFHSDVLNSMNYNQSRDQSEVVRENGLGGGYQVVIQTPEYQNQNMLTKEGLLKHVGIMQEIANLSVSFGNETWMLSDLCFKPAKPDMSDGAAKDYEDVVDKIIPCIWITPIDCFWEGAKPLGPSPAVHKGKDLGPMSMLRSVDKIEGSTVSWKNLDPSALIHEIDHLLNLGTYALMFDRAGIGRGYLERPCMEPLDLECPKESPNYWETCESGILDRWITFMHSINETVENDGYEEYGAIDSLLDILGGMRKKRQAVAVDGLAAADEAANKGSVEGEVEIKAATTTTKRPPTEGERKKHCMGHRRHLHQWMAENRGRWAEFLQPHELPMDPKYEEVMNGGCKGFASGVLQWPEDMILGDTKKDETTQKLTSASALQSVFLVASPNDVYLRFKGKAGAKTKPDLDQAEWNQTTAEEAIKKWQRAFTQMIYKHRHNFQDVDGYQTERRTIHPLASTSIADMLEEFCQFNYTIILVGYGLMLLYAMITQLRTEKWLLPAAHSCMGLAFAGVLTVTFASVAGLGLATWFGIEFNAATTQIVPFLTLGIGVDNMFMLLHNYHDVVQMTRRHEIGVLLRETGMSILCTSSNNILSFLAGTLLPIPALRSFCAQSTILLTFNLVAILTIYPAIISLDLRRRKSGRLDILCCLFSSSSATVQEQSYSMMNKKSTGIIEKKTIGYEAGDNAYGDLIREETRHKDIEEPEHPHHGFMEEVVPYTLHAAIRNYYIPLLRRRFFKGFVILSSIILCVVAVFGMRQASIGLELSDVLPEHTAPAAFLKARDAYFSFYPMFAVLKGEGIDFARKQSMIEAYREAIGNSDYVIKKANSQPSEAYWLGMMKDWLLSIQSKTDAAVKEGILDATTGNIKLSDGRMVDSEVPGKIKGIDEDVLTGYRLMCSVGDVYQCKGRVGTVRLVDDVGNINVESFYNYLTAWFNQDNMMYYVTQASFFPSPPAWSLSQNDSVLVPAAQPLAYSQIPFYLTGLTNTPVIVEAIKEIRGICDRYTEDGLPNYPQGIAFTFWEQYLHLNGNLMQAIATIALAVFCVLSVLLFSPWAAASILAILVCMTIQLAGFLGWAGIKLNPVSAVTLITAVGIGVEFTAHVVLAFLTSLGSRQQRMASAVDRVFVPVIHGALSTLLGIFMLAFSEFEFVVKYFFVVMSALIVIGLINGLILLPVLLSLTGPPTEIVPVGNKRRLLLPPPLPSH